MKDKIFEAYQNTITEAKSKIYIKAKDVRNKKVKSHEDAYDKLVAKKWVQYSAANEEEAKLLVVFNDVFKGKTFRHFAVDKERDLHITQVYLGNSDSNATRAFNRWKSTLSDRYIKTVMKDVKVVEVPK